MERLTRAHYKAGDGHYLVCSEMCEREDCTAECGHFDEAIERLADYEDAGLSPQACVKLREIEDGLSANGFSISGMVDYMQTVSAALDSADAIGLLDYTLEASETLQEQLALTHRMVELMRADKDGRLVVLPHCKLGDTVYWLHDKKITECRVYRIQENTKGVQIAIKSTVSHGVFSVDDYFGKTIFLTREEAEKALEGRR